jgi:hypothetical protein
MSQRYDQPLHRVFSATAFSQVYVRPSFTPIIADFIANAESPAGARCVYSRLVQRFEMVRMADSQVFGGALLLLVLGQIAVFLPARAKRKSMTKQSQMLPGWCWKLSASGMSELCPLLPGAGVSYRIPSYQSTLHGDT